MPVLSINIGKPRKANIRRVGEVARLAFEHGHLVLCTFISPFRADRRFARSLLREGRFFEVYVKCDLEVAKRRDPKGLYAKALAGEIKEFTGVSSPYEAPEAPELVIESDLVSAEDAIEVAPTLTLSPQAGLLLTKITDTPDLESALWRVLHDYTKLKTDQLKQEIKALELKWQMTFEEFSQRCQDGSLGLDPYAYEVESDFWDWEKATTLLQHYEALQKRWM